MEHVIQNYNGIFWNIVKNYDLNNSNILRKHIHSFEVARNCYSLACSKGLNEKERNFCYLMGLFHDIGRFEQWKIYQTYDDTKSVDHGDLSCEILEKLDASKLFNISERDSFVLKESIKYHTKPYKGDDKDIKFFNNIINNCDAFSNIITTANGAQEIIVKEDGHTPEILEAFNNRELLVPFKLHTKLDRCFKLTACCYYVKEKFFRDEILKCNYIDIIYESFSKYLIEEDKKIYKQAIEKLKQEYLN